jgi:ubiquinone/menaquinone biosynthesis C-methylase UbiE
MLEKAKEKKLNAALIQGDAMNLPYENDFFDYVKLRFALHHFPDKQKGIREINRILKHAGILSIENICHDYMKRSWVYEYFPGTETIDNGRFISTIDLYSMLSDNGFSVDADINVKVKKISYDEMIHEAENRDMSQLTIISDREFEDGLSKMKEDSLKKNHFTGDIALMNFTCRKH